MTTGPKSSNGVSRRRLLKVGAAMTGALTIGTGMASAHHGDDNGTQGGEALVRVGHYIPGEAFTLRFETAFPKPQNCQDESSPEVNWACYTMNYVESGIQASGVTGFDFEVRPDADHVDAGERDENSGDGPDGNGEFGDTEYVLGPQAQECSGDFPGDWLSTAFKPV